MIKWVLNCTTWRRTCGPCGTSTLEAGRCDDLEQVPRLNEFDFTELFNLDRVNPLIEDYFLSVKVLDEENEDKPYFEKKEEEWLSKLMDMPSQLLVRKYDPSEEFADVEEAKRYFHVDVDEILPEDFHSEKEYNMAIEAAKRENRELINAVNLYQLAEVLTFYEGEEYYVKEF